MRLAIPSLAVLALVLAGLPARAQQPAGPFETLACAPGDPDVAAVLSGGFVHVTRDGGATWTRAFPGAPLGGEDDGPGPVEDGAEPSEAPLAGDDDEAGDDASEVDPEPEWLDGPTRQQAHGGPGTSRALLAVADDGRFAVAVGETLVLGGASARREVTLPGGVRGLRFDGEGELWIAAGERILRVPPRGGVSEAATAVSGAPGRGPDGGVLVPTRDGVLVSRGGEVGGAPTRRLPLPVAAGRATAWDPGRPNEILVVARGRLERFPLDGGPGEDLGRAPAAAERLVPLPGGDLLLRQEGGAWFRRCAAGWKAVEILDADADASGRPWIATDRGVDVPGSRRVPTGSRPRFAGAGALEPRDEVGPPPCEPAVVFPVPRVELFLGIGHGSTRTSALPEDADHLERRSLIRGGLRLAGSFGRGAAADCLPRLEAWAAWQEQRRRRLAALSRARSLAAAGLAAASGPAEAARARFETERLDELIRLMTGGPAEEERP